MLIIAPLLAAQLVSTVYILDVIGRKLDRVASILIRVAERLGVDVGAEVQSPGQVYVQCRWLRISREEARGGIRHIYVYCAHPRNPMTRQGCPRGCPYLDVSDTRSGTGAYIGLVIGGLAGMVVGGPAGVVLGGVLGALIGNMLEEPKPVEARVKSLVERGEQVQIHVDGSRLKGRE